MKLLYPSFSECIATYSAHLFTIYFCTITLTQKGIDHLDICSSPFIWSYQTSEKIFSNNVVPQDSHLSPREKSRSPRYLSSSSQGPEKLIYLQQVNLSLPIHPVPCWQSPKLGQGSQALLQSSRSESYYCSSFNSFKNVVYCLLKASCSYCNNSY